MFFIPHLLSILIIPLVPSYVLYKNLPSKTTVTGPFKGLNINLTGAFGGYFLLVLVSWGVVSHLLVPAESNYEIWSVTGMVESSETDENLNDHVSGIKETAIGVTPPNFIMGSSGDFSITVICFPGHVKGIKKFPTLTVNRDGYYGIILPLSMEDLTIDDMSKVITINKPIMLQKLKETAQELKEIR